jgi:SAM-dependent methyltransferase
VFDSFPNFVRPRALLSPTEQIELNNLESQVEKIHREDWRDDYNIPRIDQVVRFLPSKCDLLDIGAADGQIAAYLHKKYGHRVICVEKTPKWLEVHGRADVPFVFADVYRLPFDARTFDAVFMGEILEHVYDPSAAVKEACRVLKPGGVLVGTVPNFYFLVKRFRYLIGRFGEDPSHPLTHEHIRLFSRHAIEQLVACSMLQNLEVVGIWPHNYFLNGVFRPLRFVRAVFERTGFASPICAVTFVFRAAKAA